MEREPPSLTAAVPGEPDDPGDPSDVRAERVHAIDVAVALGLAALSLIAYASGDPTVGPPGAPTVALLLLESLPLVVRRRFPLAVMLVVVSATIVHIALVPSGGSVQAGLGVLVAIYTIGERLDRPTSMGLTALTGVIVAALFLSRAGLVDVLQGLIQTELILGIAWLLGDAARTRRLYAQALVERAGLLDREREERTQRAILEERERIARDLHDVVTHHVSVMVIQAGGAASVLERRPAEARTALEAIAATGRQALTDMRRLLGILGDEQTPAPAPGIEDIGELVAQVRAAGQPVELLVEGSPRPLDPGLELTAYRIVQEGLTNSMKHARGGRTKVTVRYEPEALALIIDDERGPVTPPPVEPDHEGRGLIGMRERASMLRGTFAAQPTPTGYRVTARLPTGSTIVG